MGFEQKEVPKVVSLVALGHSKLAFFNECITTGSRRGVADEVWVINKAGVLLKHDKLFRMDDLSTMYSMNNKRFTGGSIEKEGRSIHETYTDFLMNHDKPIITSKAYPEFPMSVEYPLAEVINKLGFPYLRTTPAFAAAFALYIGVKQLRIYGCDYVYPSNKYSAEAGRANLEFILGIAMDRGMDVFIPNSSTLLDTSTPVEELMYGYKDPVSVTKDENDKFVIKHEHKVGEEIRKKKEGAERQKLQALLSKYSTDVLRDLVHGEWITHADIDRILAEPYDKKPIKKEDIKPIVKEAPEWEVHSKIYESNKLSDTPVRAADNAVKEN